MLEKQNPIKKWEKDLNRYFSKEDNRWLTRGRMLNVKANKILFRMAIIKKSTKNICWRGCGEKKTLLHF